MHKIIMFFLLSSYLIFPFSVSSLSVSARNAVVMDIDSGRILYSKAKDEPHLIASITKIMTCVLAIESGKTEDIVTIGEEVLTMYGSNIYLELHEKMKLKDLLYGLMLRSGNDAAIVIATYIGSTEAKFVEQMNQKAKEIGMDNTIFTNSHGLDEKTKNYSTAHDMAKLSAYASKLPLYREISKTKKYTVASETKTYIWHNRNDLLYSYKYATGGKTGYTPKAGKTLVTTSNKNGLALTAVTLNDGNQYKTQIELYEDIYNKYDNYIILNKNKFKIDEAFYKDKIIIKNSFSYPLTSSEKDQIKILIQLTKLEKYKDNTIVGMAKVYLRDTLLKEEPIYVLKKEKVGIKYIITSIYTWFTTVFNCN
ncbi:MAG: D-alanyl-D-alanine carboxypeptidase family protein [Bacilli bacterium]